MICEQLINKKYKLNKASKRNREALKLLRSLKKSETLNDDLLQHTQSMIQKTTRRKE